MPFPDKLRSLRQNSVLECIFTSYFTHVKSLAVIDGSIISNRIAGAVVIEELQEMLRIGRSKAYQLLRSGHIKALRDGRVWLIPKKSVIEYVIGRCG